MGLPLQSAETLEIEFEDMSIPLSVKELSEWVNRASSFGEPDGNLDTTKLISAAPSELADWLSLLDEEGREALIKILNAPLIKNRSMARQMLRSWTGRKLLDEVSDFVRVDDDLTGKRVFLTFESLLVTQPSVNTLDLLQSLPGKTIQIDLNALLLVANQWRDELQSQQELVLKLDLLPPYVETEADFERVLRRSEEPFLETFILPVNHRDEPLNLEVWRVKESSYQRSSWIVLMPGLGGTQDHFRWLAQALSTKGWTVVILEHPGSDAKAVRELLVGENSLPGAEVLPERLSDLDAVLLAKTKGSLGISAEKVVLMGHSLGALTAFLASGALPQVDLPNRCNKALDDLSLTNLSKLLQCQLTEVSIPKRDSITELNAIVAINSFGSLLWPDQASAKISAPVFLTGGTYDLITPALSEQLGLLLAIKPNNLNRALLIKGASHFSPIRVEGQSTDRNEDDLFQLGESLVGAKPVYVQRLLAQEIIRFLDHMESGKAVQTVGSQDQGDLQFYVLDRLNIEKLLED